MHDYLPDNYTNNARIPGIISVAHMKSSNALRNYSTESKQTILLSPLISLRDSYFDVGTEVILLCRQFIILYVYANNSKQVKVASHVQHSCKV